MKTINNQQLRIMHSLLNNLNLMEFKADFVQEYSNGRVQSSKGLSEKEANELIDHLKKLDPSDRLRKKVISNCYQIGLIYGHTAEDKKMNLAVVNAFVLKHGYLKKELNSYKRVELPKLVYQFNAILASTIKKREKKLEAEILQSAEIEHDIKMLIHGL